MERDLMESSGGSSKEINKLYSIFDQFMNINFSKTEDGLILKEWLYFQDMIRSQQRGRYQDSYFEMLEQQLAIEQNNQLNRDRSHSFDYKLSPNQPGGGLNNANKPTNRNPLEYQNRNDQNQRQPDYDNQQTIYNDYDQDQANYQNKQALSPGKSRNYRDMSVDIARNPQTNDKIATLEDKNQNQNMPFENPQYPKRPGDIGISNLQSKENSIDKILEKYNYLNGAGLPGDFPYTQNPYFERPNNEITQINPSGNKDPISNPNTSNFPNSLNSTPNINSINPASSGNIPYPVSDNYKDFNSINGNEYQNPYHQQTASNHIGYGRGIDDQPNPFSINNKDFITNENINNNPVQNITSDSQPFPQTQYTFDNVKFLMKAKNLFNAFFDHDQEIEILFQNSQSEY